MKYPISHPRNVNADLETAEKALDEIALMARDPDNKGNQSVHAYTVRMGTIYNEFFEHFDNRYALTTAKKSDFEQTAQEILMFTPPNMQDNVRITLQNIRALKGKIENKETQLDITKLLVKTWELARKVNYDGAILTLIDNLNQNVVTGGGCYPGIAARLVIPYAIFLKQAALDKLDSGVNLNTVASIIQDPEPVMSNNNARPQQTYPTTSVSIDQNKRPATVQPTSAQPPVQTTTSTQPVINKEMTKEERAEAIMKIRRERAAKK